MTRALQRIVAGLLLGLLLPAVEAQSPPSREAANLALFEQLRSVHGLSPQQMQRIRAIFAGSRVIGQGNPAISRHPLSVAECEARVRESGAQYGNPLFERICGAKYMAPLYDPRHERPEDARACIDQFEFPDIPCTYPVVWVKAREAAQICEAQGKRLCDAHEWEGACDGALEAPDYPFDLAAGVAPELGLRRMRDSHNRTHLASARWSYGPDYRRGICATGSSKSAGCNGGGWKDCGSNTYPTGAFPACQSPLGVHDVNGNAAEHMNLPLSPQQMLSRGSSTAGYTEMKGSWFIFDTYRAHPDWCRWRAPYWHGTRVMSEDSHANYHLGFRCCTTLNKPASRLATPAPSAPTSRRNAGSPSTSENPRGRPLT